MAPGIKIFSLFLLIIALSGAMIPVHAQSRDRSRTDRPERSSRPEGPARDSENDRGDRNSSTQRLGGGERSGRTVTQPDQPTPVTLKPGDVVILPVAVPVIDPIDLFWWGNIPSKEIITNVINDDPVDYFDGWTPQWKLGYNACITSYGMGAHVLIPAGTAGNSEVFMRLGMVLFSKSRDFIIDGYTYESGSGLLPLALMLKTTHFSGQNSYGEYRLYSALGGGPVLGFAFPANFEEGKAGDYSRWSLAGEFFGALGAEFVLNNHIGYYAEAGFSYINFAGRSFSTTQQILSPTLSVGIRFY